MSNLTDNPRPECTCTSSMDNDESGGPAIPKVDPDCPYHGGNRPDANDETNEALAAQVPVDPSLETNDNPTDDHTYAVAQDPNDALDPEQRASEQAAAEDVDSSISTDTEDTPVSAAEERADEERG